MLHEEPSLQEELLGRGGREVGVGGDDGLHVLGVERAVQLVVAVLRLSAPLEGADGGDDAGDADVPGGEEEEGGGGEKGEEEVRRRGRGRRRVWGKEKKDEGDEGGRE